MPAAEIVAPTLATDRAGNSVTARRYARMFGELGLDATVVATPSGAADVVIALNAYRSAAAIESAAASRSRVVVVLTGTDIYRFMTTDREIVVRSLDHADRLVALNDRVGETLEPRLHSRLHLIHEAAMPNPTPRVVGSDEFEVAVVGHLRDEKDPRTVAAAVAGLPANSRIRVNHYGAAHTDEWASWARSEGRSNARYHWHGEVPWDAMAAVYAQSHVLVNSSVMEGGANAISEAVMAGLPIIASDIPGNVGVLGDAYDGYFPVGDANALRCCLLGLERESGELRRLEASISAAQPRFAVELERARWAALFEGLGL